MSFTYSFEKLEIWQDSRILIREIYKRTNTFPETEKHCLISQMHRAAISIASNIAEGSSRSSRKDQIRFYEIAYGSLTELYCQVILSKDLEYLDNDGFEAIKEQINKISNKLNALRKSMLNR